MNPFTLTKESFWDEQTRLHPIAMQDFSKWIDEYKADVNWDDLFVSTFKPILGAPKFHDLPDAMQIGIFFYYLAQRSGEETKYLEAYKKMITGVLKEVQGGLAALEWLKDLI